jgi:hypothetical protein
MPLGSDERQEARQLARKADQIAMLILASDYPLIDVQIARSNLRDEAEQICPERIDVYDRIYESRFDRLIEQFRELEE